MSSNKLPSVLNVELEDVDSVERQIFPNLKNFRLNFDVDEMRVIYNCTEAKTLERVFIKSLDILVEKEKIENINFLVHLDVPDILVLESFVDELEIFVSNYNQTMDRGQISIELFYTTDFKNRIETDKQTHYKPGLGLSARFERAFDHLKKMPENYLNFKIQLEAID